MMHEKDDPDRHESSTDVDMEADNSAEVHNMEAEDNFSVWWNEPADQDPENPMNWANSRKWSIIGTLSAITFLTPLASAMMAPGVPQILVEFGTSNNMIATFVVSIFVLGFAVGPLLMAPMSEIYGRVPVYHVSNILFVIFSAACALSTSIEMLMVFRFFSGLTGVAVVTCGSGTVADLMPAVSRGRAMAIWSMGPLFGPVIGPVCAGFLVEATSWRWVFWVITIVSGVVVGVSLIVFKETYAPVLLERKAARLRKETGNDRYQSRLKREGTPKQLFIAAIFRPMRMFIFSPVVMVICLYVAVVYGLLYILFTTFTFVYSDVYQFSSVGAGLSFLGGGIGTLIGLAFVGVFSDRLLKQHQARGETLQAETRLHLAITVPSGLTLAAGLFIYGWTANPDIHWIVSMIGVAIMSFGTMGLFMSAQTYLVDAYPTYAASATAANAVLRSILGATLPLCGLDLYDALGLGWGNTLLGFLALIMAPIPWVLYLYGTKIRTSERFKKDF